MDNGVTPASTRRWYRWLVPRFSLRTLLITVTVFAVAFGFWVERAERQRRIMEFLANKKDVSWGFDDNAPNSANRSIGEIDHYWRSVTTLQSPASSFELEEANETLAQIARLPALKRLYFFSRAPDLDWSPLTKAASLTDLDMFGINLRSRDIEAISKIPRLKNLKLSCAGSMPADLSSLAGAQNLAYLHLELPYGNGLDLSFVATLSRLKRLQVNYADDRLCEALSGSKSLRQLRLKYGDITDVGVKALSTVATLEDLDLSETLVADASIESLARLPKLKTVNLKDSRVTYRGIVRLCEHESIERVVQDGSDWYWNPQTLRDSKGTPTPFWRNGGIPADFFRGRSLAGATIDRFEIRGERLPKDVYKAIGNLSSLTSLDLSGCDVGDTDLPQLATLTKLEKLNLEGTEITAAGLRHLKGMTALQDLTISIMDDWDEVGEHLRNMPSLMVLDGTFGGFHDDLYELDRTHLRVALGEPVENETELVDLTRVPFGPTVKANLSKATHLRALWLGDTPTTDDDLRFLANHHQIEELSLGYTKVTDKIAPLLASLRTLTDLDLSGTSITDETLGQLASLPNLMSLRVNHTAVTDAGVEKLTKVRSLVEIGLRGTDITERSLTYLKNLPRLQKLNVGTSYPHWLRPGELPRGALAKGAYALLKEFPNPLQLDLITEDLTPGNVAALRQLPDVDQLTTEGGAVHESLFEKVLQRPLIGSRNPTFLRHRFGSQADLSLPTWMEEEKDLAEGRQPDLETIELIQTKGTDRRLAKIAEANQAESITLIRTDVTSEGVAKLRTLHQLHFLHVNELGLGREIVPLLSEMRSLREIGLGRMKLEPEDLERFNKLPLLRTLVLSYDVGASRAEQRALKEKYPFLRMEKEIRPFR